MFYLKYDNLWIICFQFAFPNFIEIWVRSPSLMALRDRLWGQFSGDNILRLNLETYNELNLIHGLPAMKPT